MVIGEFAEVYCQAPWQWVAGSGGQLVQDTLNEIKINQ